MQCSSLAFLHTCELRTLPSWKLTEMSPVLRGIKKYSLNGREIPLDICQTICQNSNWWLVIWTRRSGRVGLKPSLQGPMACGSH